MRAWESAGHFDFDSFDLGFAAGVAEGIRQAREAVEAAVERSAEYGPHFYPDDAINAINALEDENVT